ncbi:hypothetical protein C5167_040725 [Papaver somniferum]|uniref:Myb/SANT-like DNA-binding domain-containing protein n=1 Tax=Papaver somniferum TaxID=3469 RepID=A0A4Y7IJY8_PAPSO|nr:trihelix transcription factor ASIL2-like [Papaver somniferum]RZC47775.1 hypothetical protein C5167_040725 [Papaver somniferum]
MEKEEANSSKPVVSSITSGLGGGDRLKRDEWSEGAVSCLLDAYETKWVLRNRAKLKGHDWEDVARHVSSRANSTKAPKTQTQCKNKIESMKKRYRSESSSNDPSSWPLFQRLDLLLRCRTATTTSPTDNCPTSSTTATATILNAPLLLLDPPPAAPQPPPPPPPPLVVPIHSLPHPNIGGSFLDSHESNDAVREASKEDDLRAKKIVENGSAKTSMETGSTSGSTPVSETIKEKLKMKEIKLEKNKKKRNKRRRGRGEEWEVAESIRWLAEVVMRSEQARMETMKEVEKMRMEAEAKKGEMDLKRTEIMANTQLQIAKILASNGKDIDSSLRIGRS